MLMKTMDIVGLRRHNLKKWLDDKFDGSQARFIDATGMNQGELSGLLRQKSFGEKKARALEGLAGMPHLWLDQEHIDDIRDSDVMLGATYGETDDAHLMRRAEDDSYQVPQYRDVLGAMGRGVTLRDQPGQIVGLRVTKEWLTKNVPTNTGHENLCVVTGFGDSMKGMYNPGDPLLVDTGIKSCDYDGVYFFRIGDEGFIKRLQRIPGVGIKVISENKVYETWTITQDMDFEVFAKVLKVWESTDF